MSVRVMSWVFEHSRSKKNARLVLLAIADCANDEGRQAYPSMAKLMQKTGLKSERSVTGLVADLERLGELEVKRNAGPGGCNLYRVVMTPADSAPPQEMPPAKTAGGRKKKPQAKPTDPAESATPAKPAPPQKTAATPAESAPGTVPEPSDKTSSSKRSSANERAKPKRRLPDDFEATAAMIDWAKQNTPLVGRAETESFKDYFLGAGVTKADWEATWRMWMRRAQKDAERFHGRASANGSNPNGRKPSTTDDRVDSALDLARQFAAEAQEAKARKEITAS